MIKKEKPQKPQESIINPFAITFDMFKVYAYLIHKLLSPFFSISLNEARDSVTDLQSISKSRESKINT